MTTTVKQLIEWLKTQDENKEIHVMREYYAGWCYTTEFVDLVIPEGEHQYDSPNVDVYDTWISFGER